MKKFILLVLILCSLHTVLAWTSYGNNDYNTFNSNTTGGGLLVERFTYDAGGSASFSPLVYNGKVFVFTDKITVLDKNGVVEWVYNLGTLPSSPIIFNNRLIIAGQKSGEELKSLNLDGSVAWSKSETGGFTGEPIVKNNIIFTISSSTLRGYYLNNGSLKWNNTLSSCSKGGVLIDDNVVLSCGSNLYSVNINNGSIMHSKNLPSVNTNPISVYDNLIMLSLEGDVYAYDKELVQLDRLPFFYPSKAVSTNTASGDDFYACATNGLYSIIYNNNRLYYKNFQPYSNCKSLLVFDFNNDGSEDLLFSKSSDLIIVNSTGFELAKKNVGSNLFFSVDDLDSDGKSELITISSNGVVKVFDTTSPDNTVSFLINSSGFYANITNIGFEDSVNANVTFSTPYESQSYMVNVSKGKSTVKYFNLKPSIKGKYNIRFTVNDPKDLNPVNNEAEVLIEVLNVTSDSSMELFYNNYFYDFSEGFSSEVKTVDVNNDGVKEDVITGYGLIREGDAFIPLGDLSLSVNHYYDGVYQSDIINIYGIITSSAVYPVRNVSVILLVDNLVRESRYYNMSINSSQGFNFTLSNLAAGDRVVSLRVDYENKVFEKYESNNAHSKTVLIAPVPEHGLNIRVDDSATTLHNNVLRLEIENNGDFDEDLSIISMPSVFEQKSVTINKGESEVFTVELDLTLGINTFQIQVNNDYYYFNELIDLFLTCELDSDCGGDYYCSAGECVVVDELLSSQNLSDDASGGVEVLDYSSNGSMIVGDLTGMVTVISNGFSGSIIYWAVLTGLLLVSSFSVYLFTFKLFEDKAHLFSIFNFLFFLGIAYVFQPANIFNVLLVEVLVSLLGFAFFRRA